MSKPVDEIICYLERGPRKPHTAHLSLRHHEGQKWMLLEVSNDPEGKPPGIYKFLCYEVSSPHGVYTLAPDQMRMAQNPQENLMGIALRRDFSLEHIEQGAHVCLHLLKEGEAWEREKLELRCRIGQDTTMMANGALLYDKGDRALLRPGEYDPEDEIFDTVVLVWQTREQCWRKFTVREDLAARVGGMIREYEWRGDRWFFLNSIEREDVGSAIMDVGKLSARYLGQTRKEAGMWQWTNCTDKTLAVGWVPPDETPGPARALPSAGRRKIKRKVVKP